MIMQMPFLCQPLQPPVEPMRFRKFGNYSPEDSGNKNIPLCLLTQSSAFFTRGTSHAMQATAN